MIRILLKEGSGIKPEAVHTQMHQEADPGVLGGVHQGLALLVH
jgi:hypothetical protein